MREALNWIIGPLALLGAASYLRAAIVKHSFDNDRSEAAGALVCFFVVGYLAIIRLLVGVGLMDVVDSLDWTLPMAPMAYVVHIYAGFRMTSFAHFRERTHRQQRPKPPNRRGPAE